MDLHQRTIIAEIARQQHGVLTTGQIHACGVSPRELQGAVARGELLRVRQRVHMPFGGSLDWHGELMADLLACYREAFAARTAVLILAGVTMEDLPLRRELVVEGMARPQVDSDVIVHRTRSLPEEDRTVIERIPATTVERAIIDLAPSLRWDQRVELVDAALFSGAASPEVLLERGEALEPGRPGVRGVRAIAAAHGGQRFRSLLEKIARPLFEEAGLTDVRCNVTPLRATDAGEMDAVSEAHALVIELDGLRYHRMGIDRQRDNDKSNALAGRYRLLRFTWLDIVRRPRMVVARIRALLASSPRAA